MYSDRSRVVGHFTTIGKQSTNHAKNVETQHKHMVSLYTGRLCNIAFSKARFTCIVTLKVFEKIYMQ